MATCLFAGEHAGDIVTEGRDLNQVPTNNGTHKLQHESLHTAGNF